MKIKLKKQEHNFFKRMIFNCLFALITILVVIFFYKKILIASLLLALTSFVWLYILNSNTSLKVFLFGAIFGSFSEMVCIYFGVWSYTNPNFFTIPLWLFLAWGNAAVFLYEVGREISLLNEDE